MCLKKMSKLTIMTLKGYVENFLSILRSKSDSFEIFLISEILTILQYKIDFKKKAENLGDLFIILTVDEDSSVQSVEGNDFNHFCQTQGRQKELRMTTF